MLFIATSLHIQDKNYTPIAWGLLALLLLVYPHLQYWRACRAEKPVHAEMTSLLVDSVLLGIFVAALAFPLWLGFSAVVGTLTNNAANKGWRGVGETLLALPGGALIWIAIGGFDLSPDTDWPTTLFCIVGLIGYLAAVGNLGFVRNRQLRVTREELRLREQELLTANEALLNDYQEIDALQQQLREQATRDPLTGLYNRRYLNSTMERELARCKRDGQPLAVVMIDIDYFKKINDTYGHPAGDEVLRNLGAMLGSMARAADLACRYGGEEFLLLMPTMTLQPARVRADELRAAFGATVVEFGDFRLQATLSIGIAVYPDHGSSANELINCADRALYRAKLSGRDQVQVARQTPRRHDAGESPPADFMQLVWRSAYECGDAVIDDQHRRLFRDANKLFASLLSERGPDEVSALVKSLVGDVVQHFQDEEAIMTMADYPEVAEHAAIHRELLDRATALGGRFERGELDVGDLFQFLAHELVARHILRADREFFEFMSARRERSGLAEGELLP